MIFNNPYKGDFDHKPEVTKSGHFKDHYFYSGDFFNLNITPKEKMKSVFVLLLFFISSIALLVISGLVNQDSSRTWYVVFPYLITFMPICFFAIGILYYALSPLKMNRAEFDKGILRMKHSAYGAIAVLVISIVCDFVYIIKNIAEVRLSYELIYVGILIVICVIEILFGKYYTKMFGSIEVEKINQ